MIIVNSIVAGSKPIKKKSNPERCYEIVKEILIIGSLILVNWDIVSKIF